MLAGPRSEDNLDFGAACADQGGIARALTSAGHASNAALPALALVCAGFRPWRPRSSPPVTPRGRDR